MSSQISQCYQVVIFKCQCGLDAKYTKTVNTVLTKKFTGCDNKGRVCFVTVSSIVQEYLQPSMFSVRVLQGMTRNAVEAWLYKIILTLSYKYTPTMK